MLARLTAFFSMKLKFSRADRLSKKKEIILPDELDFQYT